VTIKEVTMWQVICEGCGACAQEGDFYAWADAGQAEAEAEASEWVISDSGHWCPGCIVLDDDGEMVPTAEDLAAARQRQETGRMTTPGRADQPQVVCLCGSTRFYTEFAAANLRLTLAGEIVPIVAKAAATTVLTSAIRATIAEVEAL
jgi:hypothetical protein